MHNTYMSKEDFKQLKAGDQVTIRQIDDLCHDFGSEINVPCGWADDMDNICGSTLPIDYVENEQDGSTAVVYVHDDNDNEWALTAEVSGLLKIINFGTSVPTVQLEKKLRNL